jgi:DNA polymerase III alpha subunit (gram-positive type)
MNNKSFDHLMLDLETMGTRSYSSIISIGALEFDINTGETGKEFYVNVDINSCLESGLIIEESTSYWWSQQSNQAKEALEKDPVSIEYALISFSQFCNETYQVWGNSARFDCGILQNAYNKMNMPIPWSYKNERCLRTLVSFMPEVKDEMIFEGIAHNALDDCYFQVKYCSKIWNLLHGNKNVHDCSQETI